MSKMPAPTALLVVLALAPALTGCELFDLSCKRVAGAYCLDQWEDGQTYYLEIQRPLGQQDDNGGGVIDGTVLRLGWNKSYILADRKPLVAGDPSGWMLIDINTRRVSGPFDDATVMSLPEAKGMHFVSASEAWKELR
jgi:hypothetical protein